MSFFKCKVGDETYELERLTIGDSRILKRDFGLSDLEHFNPGDPDVVAGLLTLAISKAKDIPISEATKIADAVDFEDFESISDDEEEGAEDPTPAAEAADDAGAKAAPSRSGSRAKPRKTTGSPS